MPSEKSLEQARELVDRWCLDAACVGSGEKQEDMLTERVAKALDEARGLAWNEAIEACASNLDTAASFAMDCSRSEVLGPNLKRENEFLAEQLYTATRVIRALKSRAGNGKAT